MPNGLTIPKQHVYSLQCFCENNEIRYNFLNYGTYRKENEAQFHFTTTNDRDKAGHFLRRLVELSDPSDSYNSH